MACANTVLTLTHSQSIKPTCQSTSFMLVNSICQSSCKNVLWYSQGHCFLPSSPTRHTTGTHTPLNLTAKLLPPPSFETRLAASLGRSSSCFLSHHTILIPQHSPLPLSPLESAVFIFSLIPFSPFSAVEDIEELDTHQQDIPLSYVSSMPSQLTVM